MIDTVSTIKLAMTGIEIPIKMGREVKIDVVVFDDVTLVVGSSMADQLSLYELAEGTNSARYARAFSTFNVPYPDFSSQPESRRSVAPQTNAS
ncbi:MAG: hypothetical protein ACXABH_12710, partial [Candidatus Thorarchaeota archaeon]